MTFKRISIVVIGCLATGACSSGSGGTAATPTPPPPPPPPPPVDQAMGGIWVGVLTNDMSQTSELFVALATDDGRFRFLSGESGLQFVGTQVINTTHIVGTGIGYADPAVPWLDASVVSDTSTDGQLIERDSFSGIWSTASGESGNFDLFYNDEYESPSSLSLLEGVWTAYDDFRNPTATFTIDAMGQFTGQNTSGCTSSGQISLIDDRYSMYDVTSTISNCFIAGDYSGLAITGELSVPNDAIILSISNTDRALVLGLEK
ncbi:MAG: hypothetical protein OEM63_04960 [Gammaproteobacteria bacterium]|nr:hypothetical protein [Gammaproteobacteria bacterium]